MVTWTTWGNVANVSSRDILRNSHLHFHNTKLGRGPTSTRKFSTQTLKSSPIFCCFLFSLSFFSLPRFWTDWQTFFACVQPAVSGNICYQNRMYVVVTLTNSYVYDRKFFVWKHGMLCALKINSNDRFKRACGILLFNDYISSNSIAVYIH